MYTDTAVTNPDLLLGTGQPDDTQQRLDAALREAIAAKAKVRWFQELLPALRDTARLFLVTAMARAKCHAIRAEFLAAGLDAPAPACLLGDPADLPELVRMFVESGLIDPHDVLIADAPRPVATNSTSETTADGTAAPME